MKKISIFMISFTLYTVSFLYADFKLVPAEPSSKPPELVVQEWHNGGPKHIKYSADGKYIMSAKDEIKIWEVDTGFLICTIPARTNCKADFSADGQYVIYESDSDRNIVKICNVQTGKIVFSKQLYYSLDDVFFSRDAKHFILIEHKNIYFYDLNPIKEQFILQDSRYSYYSNGASLSNDGKYITAIAWDKNEHTLNVVWDIEARKIINTINFKKALEKTDISSDNNFVACCLHKIQKGKPNVFIHKINSDKIEYSFYKEGDYAEDIKFLSNDRKVLLLADNFLKMIDYQTGKVVWSQKVNDGFSATSSIAVSPDERNFAIGNNHNIIIGNIFTGEIIKRISGANGFSFFSHTLKDSYFGGTTKYRFMFNSNFEKQILPNAFEMTKFYSRNQPVSVCDKGVYYCGKEGICFYDFTQHETTRTFNEKEGADRLSANLTGTFIACMTFDTRIYIYDKEKGDVVQKFNAPYTSTYDFKLSPYGNFLYVSTFGFGDSNSTVFDIKTGEKYVFSGSYGISFSSNDEYCCFGDKLFDTKKWTLLCEWKEQSFQTAFSNNGMNIARMLSNGEISIDSLKGKNLVRIKTIDSYIIKDMFFSSDDKKIIILTYGGLIRCYDIKTCNLLSTTCADEFGDWITYTPEGYFTGSPGGIQKFVHVVRGMEVSELGQYAETLFRPDLVAAKIRGEDISKEEGTISLAELVSTGEAPLVSFVNPPPATNNRDITVNFNVQDMGGGIGSVYLKINGKVIQLADGSRKLELVGGSTSTTQKSSGKTTQFGHLLTLQNGENTLEAYAYNSAGKIESLHATAKITWQGKTAKPNLYVLAVGVNKYRDRSLWLNYAVPDATSIADQFRSVKGNLYQSVNVTSIFDGDVTANGICSAFNSLASKVGADDVFIFYLSGHGTTHTDGDYYFIPVNFRFRNAQSVPETAVSKHFITEQLSKIKAQKTLVMLDTCNSGAFISTGARGMAEKTAIDRLSRATGQATIAASSDTQSAMEGYEGHGIFTYVILEGLSGKADANKDGYVSLSELSAYAEEKVPDYSYAKWGYEQYPQVDLRKQSNFPLVGK